MKQCKHQTRNKRLQQLFTTKFQLFVWRGVIVLIQYHVDISIQAGCSKITYTIVSESRIVAIDYCNKLINVDSVIRLHGCMEQNTYTHQVSVANSNLLLYVITTNHLLWTLEYFTEPEQVYTLPTR